MFLSNLNLTVVQAPPDYGSPPGVGSAEPSYDVPDTQPDTTTEKIDVEPSGKKSSKNIVLPILVIRKYIKTFIL